MRRVSRSSTTVSPPSARPLPHSTLSIRSPRRFPLLLPLYLSPQRSAAAARAGSTTPPRSANPCPKYTSNRPRTPPPPVYVGTSLPRTCPCCSPAVSRSSTCGGRSGARRGTGRCAVRRAQPRGRARPRALDVAVPGPRVGGRDIQRAAQRGAQVEVSTRGGAG